MSLEDIRVAVTLLSFAAFVGMLAWAWSARHRARFHDAAHLPFAHDDAHTPPRSDTP